MNTSTTPTPNHRRPLGALLVLAALGFAACSGSTSPTAAPTAQAVAPTATPVVSAAPTATAAPASSPAPVATPGSAATAVPTSIDPCQLITAQEAGTLAGATFGAGKEETLKGNSRMCTYGAGTKNVFGVIVGVAPDVATAKTEEAAAEAQLQASAAQMNQGMTITKLPGFAPGTDAVLLELKPNVLGIEGRAIYLLRGTVFAGFNDLVVGGKAPTADAMKAEAMSMLGRLP